MPIHRGPRHVQHPGDLRDRAFPGIVEALSELDLIGAEFRWAPALAAASAGRREAVAGVGHGQLALVVGQDREQPEHGLALGRSGVDALFEHLQADATLAQVGTERDQVQHRPPEPLQPGNHQNVAFAQLLQYPIELGP
ncbi:hypothetical protein MLGJGCBP_03515 [Rhodococcus sp. T7]|nr:hypothetical protein MLGJGCBP_03515 [Rhodococcus sp. T7]